jgi:hypothetical protein
MKKTKAISDVKPKAGENWRCHCLDCGKDFNYQTYHCSYCESIHVTCTKLPPVKI